MPGRQLQQALEAATRRPDELSPADFETSPNSMGKESIVAEIKADTAIALRDGPVKLAVPAYESFQTAGDGSSQTFTLSAEVVETPDTQDAVVWFGGDYQGVPSIDYGANEITVTGPGTVETVHVFHVSPKPATVEFRKSVPDNTAHKPLWDGNLGLIQQTNQDEQPEHVSYGRGLNRFVATDMSFEIMVDAPYTVRFEDGDGDGATATNALLQLRVFRSNSPIDGLREAVKNEM